MNTGHQTRLIINQNEGASVLVNHHQVIMIDWVGEVLIYLGSG